jgi:DNA-binding protein YbaB
MSLTKLINAQEVDYNNLMQQYEQMVSRAQSLQSSGNNEDRIEGNLMMSEARQLQNTIGDLRQEINANIRHNNRP